MSQTSPALAAALLDAAEDLHTQRRTEDVLDTIVHVAVNSLPGIDHAGVSLVRKDGRIETLAGTDDLVWQLDSIQYELGEGPCVDAIVPTEPPVVAVDHIRSEQRWPRYVARAVQYGLTAQVGLQLISDGSVYGGLNLYATGAEVIDPDVAHTAELLAVHAAIALGRSRREEDLTSALATRKTIGLAIGILMERYRIGHDSAFGYLTRVSQQSNTKLREVAAEIVAQTESANSAHPRPQSPG